MIYTSYFGALNQIMEAYPDQFIPISICGKAPDGWQGLQYKKLAPKYEFFQEWKKTHDNDYYVEHYHDEVLSKLDPAEVVTKLYEMSDGKDIILVCYEKSGDFCHRHLVSKWLIDNGVPCLELTVVIDQDDEI